MMSSNNYYEVTETPTYKVLGVNINPDDFSTKLREMHSQDKDRYQILVGVCARLMFAE